MRWNFFNLKTGVALGLAGVIIFAAANHEAGSALIDWAKHEEWRRKQLEALVAEVKLKGSAPYVIMSFSEYDGNHDGAIDRNEVEAIQSILSQPLKTKPKK